MGRHGCLAATLVLLASSALAAASQQESPPPRIGAIEVVSREVFEELSEGFVAPYRLLNKGHIRTKESVIRRELLFATGEVLNSELLAQTERNLRALPFLRDARVETTPVDLDGDGLAEHVDVRVVTSDTWSLAPAIDFQQIEDRTIWEIGLSQKNLLGLGKEVTFSQRTDLDRTSTRLLYHDPQLVGSRFVFTTSVANLSDGDETFVTLHRPYVSLNDRWTVSFRGGAFSRRDPIFEHGVEVGQLPHSGQWGDLQFGRAIRRRPTSALRFHVAYRLREERVGLERRDFGIMEVGFRSVEHRFVQLTYVNKFEKTEDFNLGAQSYGTLGRSAAALGGHVFFTAAGHSQGFAFSTDHFVVVSVDLDARHDQGRWVNTMAAARMRYLRKHSLRHALVGNVEFHRGHNLDPEVQLLLGAESGLRGYPVRQFAGTRSLLLSAEERWFVADDILQLASLGVAAFVDSGFVWPETQGADLADLKTAVGLSLLVGSNRLSTRGGVRFDTGYALNPITYTGRWVFFAGSEIAF